MSHTRWSDHALDHCERYFGLPRLEYITRSDLIRIRTSAACSSLCTFSPWYLAGSAYWHWWFFRLDYLLTSHFFLNLQRVHAMTSDESELPQPTFARSNKNRITTLRFSSVDLACALILSGWDEDPAEDEHPALEMIALDSDTLQKNGEPQIQMPYPRSLARQSSTRVETVWVRLYVDRFNLRITPVFKSCFQSIF